VLPQKLLFYDMQQGIVYMHFPQAGPQTIAFVEPVKDHWSVQVVYTYPLSLAEHSLSVWSRYLD
jgi:hypothetical protein